MLYAHLLKNVSLFAQASEDEILALASDFVLQSYHKGQVLFRQGSTTNSLYIVKSGVLQVKSFDRNGEITYAGTYEAGQYFGEFSMLDGLPRSGEAVALTNAELLVLTRPAFFRFLEHHPTVAIKLLVAVSRRMRFAEAAVDHPVSQDAENRLANVLIEISERYALGGDQSAAIVRLGMRLSADELASLSGVTRDLSYQIVSALQTADIISMERTHIVTVNLPKLRAYLAPTASIRT